MKQKHLYSLLDTSFTTVSVVFLSSLAVSAPANARRAGDIPASWTDSPNESRYVYKVPLAWNVQEGTCL